MKFSPFSLLSPFAIAANRRLRGHVATTIVAAIVALSVAICTWMALHNVKPKFVFMIDSVEIGGADSLTIGKGSDINFSGVPADYLTVRAKEDGSMNWRKNPIYTDSLQYFKVNNYNPNLYNVKNDNTQTITLKLPYAKGPDGRDSTLTVTLTGADVWTAWNGWTEQQNVLARHLAAGVRLRGDVPANEARKLRQQLDNRDVKSFFNATHSSLTGNITSIRLVVLDSHTTIDGKGYNPTGNTFTDITTRPADDKDCCKIQFINVSSGCYRTPKDDGYFQIDSVNYVMKTPPMLSEWGAGHIMIRHTDAGMRAVFPKAIGYVGSVDSLRNVAKHASGLITLRQEGTNFPTAGDLYLPQFSGAFGQDICNLDFNTSGDGDGIVIRDANAGEHLVSPRSFSLLPTLPKVTLRSSSNTIQCRAGIIDRAFFMSYLWLPLFATLVFLFIILGPLSPFRIKTFGTGVYAHRQLQQLPAYLACLFSIAMAYCVCKSLIALKLSYSFPYFEKITAITPATTTLMLTVAFTLVMILNHAVMTYRSPRQDSARSRRLVGSTLRAWTAWGLVAAVFGLTAYAFFGILDRDVSGSVIDSYFKHEISFTSKWWSEKAYGVNDNHRTVPYALITIEAFLLVVSALTLLLSRRLLNLWQWIDACIAAYNRRLGRLGQFLARLTGLASLSAAYRKAAARHRTSSLWQWTLGSAFFEALAVMWRTLWPSHIVLIATMAFGGPLLGNFGTAFITLGVIVGLCRALTSVRIADPDRPLDGGCSAFAAFMAMVAIAILYMLGAMVADNGYLTNFLGFIMALLCFFNIIERPGFRGIVRDAARRHERLWISIVTVLATALVVAMPFLCSHFLSSTKPNYSRSIRRIMLYSDFGNLQRSGYRYAESDAEFMVIMSHYMQTQSDGDALSNDTHPLHPSVSTGQSPVVLNDLSVPAAFFGAYGARPATAVYFLLLLALLLLVIHFSVNYDPEPGQPHLTRAMQWRILAVFMWVGTSFYIYFSYIDWIPFTGRLNPGFGVDAVGEALESAVLLAFMGAVTLYQPKAAVAATVPAAPAPVSPDDDDDDDVPQQPDILLPEPDVQLPEPEPDVQLPEPEPDVQLPEPEPDVQLPEPEPDVQLPEPEPDVQLPEPEPDVQLPEPEQPQPVVPAAPAVPVVPVVPVEDDEAEDDDAAEDDEDVIIGVIVEDDKP